MIFYLTGNNFNESIYIFQRHKKFDTICAHLSTSRTPDWVFRVNAKHVLDIKKVAISWVVSLLCRNAPTDTCFKNPICGIVVRFLLPAFLGGCRPPLTNHIEVLKHVISLQLIGKIVILILKF